MPNIVNFWHKRKTLGRKLEVQVPTPSNSHKMWALFPM
uniref:Glycosyl hydrolase family 31 family protein n=1 Tax=Rhizophora mucronata TaxID=61149 RepID=A0A2P2KY35_RHIMU